ncbi:MAG TPA: response regulator [Gemmatimonadales bacterium]|nr:response regulator [Gemmatimonadales bacterium]
MTGRPDPISPAPLPPRPTALLPPDLLLVEESPLEVELTLRALQELHPRSYIEVARDGEEALDFLFGRGAHRERSGAPPPRMILLGLKLPKMDGIEVLRAVRTNSRTSMVPVVVLTSSDDPRELAQCYQLGANSCVQKPVPYDELRAALQGVGRYWLELNQDPPAPTIPRI